MKCMEEIAKSFIKKMTPAPFRPSDELQVTVDTNLRIRCTNLGCMYVTGAAMRPVPRVIGFNKNIAKLAQRTTGVCVPDAMFLSGCSPTDD